MNRRGEAVARYLRRGLGMSPKPEFCGKRRFGEIYFCVLAPGHKGPHKVRRL